MRAAFLLVLLAAVPVRAGSGRFYAAAGKADVTPDLEKEPVWMAGYGASGRRPEGVRDRLYARAAVVSDGERTVALVAVDSIGIYIEDVRDIRRRLGWEGREDRYLFLSATHDHSAPDTLGLWGRLPGMSGVNPKYHERLKASVVSLVGDLASRMREAEVSAASARLEPGGLCRDSRDPAVLDPELNVLQLRDLKGAAIGTLVRWSCHAEVLGPENRELTADYPGALCARVEKETGGECLFFPGSVGGLMSPDVEATFEGMTALGERVASEALAALAKGADRIRRAEVAFKSRTVRLPVENSRYLLFLRSLSFGHRILDASGAPLPLWKTYWYPVRHLLFFPLPEELRPWVETEVSLVSIGPVRILGMPGELFPELALGGYDGKLSFGQPTVRPTNNNPPALGRAPKPPYLREKLGGKHGWIVGLANDEVGYIVPEYDFQAAPTRSMTPKPEGTHYEETNSIGRRAAPLLLEAADRLLE